VSRPYPPRSTPPPPRARPPPCARAAAPSPGPLATRAPFFPQLFSLRAVHVTCCSTPFLYPELDVVDLVDLARLIALNRSSRPPSQLCVLALPCASCLRNSPVPRFARGVVPRSRGEAPLLHPIEADPLYPRPQVTLRPVREPEIPASECAAACLLGFQSSTFQMGSSSRTNGARLRRRLPRLCVRPGDASRGAVGIGFSGIGRDGRAPRHGRWRRQRLRERGDGGHSVVVVCHCLCHPYR
jgi:hypothetical protein